MNMHTTQPQGTEFFSGRTEEKITKKNPGIFLFKFTFHKAELFIFRFNIQEISRIC